MIVNWIQELIAPLGRNATEGIKCALVFAGALVLSLILTPVCRELMRKLDMIDQPSERRINKTPVPRGGGVSVFIAFHVVLALFTYRWGAISEDFSLPWQCAFFIGSAALVVIGFIDDKFGMKPIVKLLGQIAVASFLFFSGIHIGGILFTFPTWLDYCVTVFWIVGAVNAFNLIDGMDGLASGLAMIASLGLAGALFFTGRLDAMIPYFALAGACLGFLRYNFHPATVFLGDTGSMFLGLCVATLPLKSGSRLELIPALIVPLLAMGIPIFDTLLAIWRRTIRARLHKDMGEGQRTQVMKPDKDHLHHRILHIVQNQRVAAWMLYGFSTALVATGLLAMVSRKGAPGVFLLAFSIAVIVIVKHLARIELWDTGRLLTNRRVAIRKGLVTPLYVVLDLSFLVLMWLLTCWVLYSTIPKHLFITHMPLRVGSVFVFLVLTKTYQRVWRRSQFSDFSFLLISVIFGVAVSSGLIEIFYDTHRTLVQFSLVFGAFALLPLIATRLASETFVGIMQTLKRHTLLQNAEVEKILLYGAGLRFRNYMREQTTLLGISDRVIVGIIDDDLQFLDRIIYGYKVLGGLDDIPSICQKNKIERVIITCVLDPEHQEALLRMAEEHKFKVSIWINEERDF